MDKKGFVCLAAATLISLSLIAGCANSGIMRVKSGSYRQAFLKDIEEKYDQYAIYALEWPADEVSVIVFDPKDDNNTIETDGWTKVTSQEHLLEVMTTLDRLWFVQFFELIGPKGDFYGYVLGGREYVWIQTVDDNTLKLFSTNSGRILRTPI